MKSSRTQAGWDVALARFAVRRYALACAIVLAIAAGNIFLGLSRQPVNDMDEARYGVSAWEMAQSHDFLVTTYAGQPEYWNLKPPLGYWLIALSFRLLGPTPFALRLPSALAALATVAVMLAAGRRRIGRRAALLAALMFASGFGFLSHHGARAGDLDAALTLVLVVAAFSIPGLGRSPLRIVLFGGLMAIGFLLKSFAILPILAITAVHLLWTGSWRKLRPLPVLAAALAFVAPIALWAALRWHADGSPAFLQRMVQEDLLSRSLQVIDKVTYEPYGYLLGIFDRFAPWPLLALAGLVAAWATRRRHRAFPALRAARPTVVLVLLWALLPLLLFTLAKTHHHWYLDPTYPAWAMLAAGAILELQRRVLPARRGLILAACALLPLVACEARIATRVALSIERAQAQRALASLADRRSELGPRLQTGPLRHSERFILEVMDGYEVDEAATVDQTPARWKALLAEINDPALTHRAALAAPGRPRLRPRLSGAFRSGS